jgi:hypothetical protein
MVLPLARGMDTKPVRTPGANAPLMILCWNSRSRNGSPGTVPARDYQKLGDKPGTTCSAVSRPSGEVQRGSGDQTTLRPCPHARLAARQSCLFMMQISRLRSVPGSPGPSPAPTAITKLSCGTTDACSFTAGREGRDATQPREAKISYSRLAIGSRSRLPVPLIENAF